MDLLIAGHERYPDSPYMFMSPKTGGMWSPESIARIHKKLLKAAGIDTGVRFHDFRHTFATLAMQSGVDAKTLASILDTTPPGLPWTPTPMLPIRCNRAQQIRSAGLWRAWR